ncbi:MAG: hypothetical protein JWP01_3598 [Myxococcales bacterium]|nr:hypothetical protein [Myxococcales bacterium]
MQAELIHSMQQQVRAIYRALTGEDVAEGSSLDASITDTDETITRRFADLEVLARRLPSVAERVPPFLVTPALDVFVIDGAVVLELAVPGMDRTDITLERVPGALQIHGFRRDHQVADGHVFHAEIPRGPFCRVIPLPFELGGQPAMDLDRGVLRIYLTAASAAVVDEPNDFRSNRQPNGSQEHRE